MTDDPLDALGRALVAVSASWPADERADWLEQLTAEGFRVLHPVEDAERPCERPGTSAG